MGTVWSNTRKSKFLTPVVIIVVAMVLAGVVGIKPVHASSPPSPPENLTVTPVSSTKIYLRWDDMSDNEIRFVIERKTGRGGYFPVNEVGSNVTVYIDYGLNPEAVYYYRVKAHGSAGDSGYSNEASTESLSSPVPSPVLMSPVKSSIATTLTPKLQWVASEDEVTYALQVAKDKNFEKIVMDKTGIEYPYYIVTESVLKWYSTYYWRVKCLDENGTFSEWSQTWYFMALQRSFGIHYCNCH
jgi:hypothetical protein